MTFRKPWRRETPSKTAIQAGLAAFAPPDRPWVAPETTRRAKIEDGGAVGEIEMDGEKYER